MLSLKATLKREINQRGYLSKEPEIALDTLKIFTDSKTALLFGAWLGQQVGNLEDYPSVVCGCTEDSLCAATSFVAMQGFRSDVYPLEGTSFCCYPPARFEVPFRAHTIIVTGNLEDGDGIASAADYFVRKGAYVDGIYSLVDSFPNKDEGFEKYNGIYRSMFTIEELTCEGTDKWR